MNHFGYLNDRENRDVAFAFDHDVLIFDCHLRVGVDLDLFVSHLEISPFVVHHCYGNDSCSFVVGGPYRRFYFGFALGDLYVYYRHVDHLLRRPCLPWMMVHHDGSVYPPTNACVRDDPHDLYLYLESANEKIPHYCNHHHVNYAVYGVSCPCFGDAFVFLCGAFFDDDLFFESLHYLHPKGSLPLVVAVVWCLVESHDQTDQLPHGVPHARRSLDALGLFHVPDAPPVCHGLDSCHLFLDLDEVAGDDCLGNVYVVALDHGGGDHHAFCHPGHYCEADHFEADRSGLYCLGVACHDLAAHSSESLDHSSWVDHHVKNVVDQDHVVAVLLQMDLVACHYWIDLLLSFSFVGCTCPIPWKHFD
mmetsp:Transcript_44705/g.107867  ORF Transcript_44705/g.107867 Transcript_44705/m.107867 type:complete len:362 (+) Transcript_44705:1674-2759(+)